ncbi:MAG TPA: hypothetical protein VGF92_10000 [Stellaceae bacterium]|jgi:hypothetical protein
MATGFLLFGAFSVGTMWIAAVPYVVTAAIFTALGIIYRRHFAGGEASAVSGFAEAVQPSIDNAALKLQA